MYINVISALLTLSGKGTKKQTALWHMFRDRGQTSPSWGRSRYLNH